MPKAPVPKIYKVTKKLIGDWKNNYVVKFKNLTKEQVKQLRTELDDVVAHFFETAQHAQHAQHKQEIRSIREY